MRTTVPYDDLPPACGGAYYMHEGDGLGTYARPAVSADGRPAVTISITTTTALVDQDKVNRAVAALTDHALCDDAAA